MAAPRRVVELAFAREDVAELTRLARSRTEPVSRAERARMLLAYRETPSFYAVGRALGVTHQTVERCLRRAEKLGIMEALDDSPRPGRERIITEEARTFVVDLACRKPKDLGYPHELWTTRLLTRHIREHGPAVGHKCLANLAQGTLCKILAAYEIKPHKVRYYLERRDPLFDEKMAEVLCVYREVEVLKLSAEATARRPMVRRSPTSIWTAGRPPRDKRVRPRPSPISVSSRASCAPRQQRSHRVRLPTGRLHDGSDRCTLGLSESRLHRLFARRRQR